MAVDGGDVIADTRAGLLGGRAGDDVHDGDAAGIEAEHETQ